MSNDRISKKGIFWNTLGGVMYGANSFIMIAVVGQLSNVEEVGYFGIAFTTAQLLYIVGLFGVNVYQMTDFSGKFGFYTYFYARIFSCACMGIFCITAVLLMQFKSQKLLYTLLLTGFMIGNAIGDVFQNQFFRKKDLAKAGSSLFFRTFWPLVVFLTTLYITRKLIIALSLQAISIFFVVWYYAKYIAPRYVADESESDLDHTKSLLKECLPLFFSMFAMNLIINISRYEVDFWLDDVAQGYYSMIFIVAQGINLCVQFIFTPLLNTYSKTYEKFGLSALQKKVRKPFLIIACLTVVICAIVRVLGAQILGMVYHKNLLHLRKEIVLLALGGGIFAATQLFYYIFTILRWQSKIFRIYIFSSFLSIPLTQFFVKNSGLIGAVLSFSLIHIFIFIFYLINFKRKAKVIDGY